MKARLLIVICPASWAHCTLGEFCSAHKKSYCAFPIETFFSIVCFHSCFSVEMIHSGSDSVFTQEAVRFNLDRVVDSTNQLMKILPIEIDIQIRTVYLRSCFCSLSWR